MEPKRDQQAGAKRLPEAASGAPSPAPPAGFLRLQRTIGNRAVAKFAARRPAVAGRREQANLQRHWMPDEEQIQARHDHAAAAPAVGRASRFGAPTRSGAGRSASRAGLWGQRSVLQRDPPNPAAAPAAPAAPAPAPAAAAVNAVTLAPAELPADGKTTSAATAKTTPGAEAVTWSIVGSDFGTTVTDAGVVTAGTDTQAKDSVDVTVKATAKTGGSSAQATLKLWDPKVLQAKKDFPTFVGGAYAFPNFTAGLNGKFDMQYVPGAQQAQVTVKVRFNFPDDPVPAASIWNFFGIGTKDIAEAKARQAAYVSNFMKTIQTQWGGRYQFQNVREPKSIWGKLNPVSVKVNVIEVDSGEHFKITVKNKSAGTAAVGGGELKLFQGDDVPKPAFNPGTGDGELARVKRNTPTPVTFGKNNQTDVDPADAAKLAFLGTYISRIANPKFSITITGHASKTGDSAKNQSLSETRAANVKAAMGTTGAHVVVASGAGDAGAAPTGDWRKVEITSAIPPGWQNMQDVTAHEFGHMLGLGDEYAGGGKPNATHYDLVKKAFGQDYADQVAKRGDTDYASIMEGGNDVRIQHYVTIWDALVQSAAKAAVPDPKFDHNDWKFIG